MEIIPVIQLYRYVNHFCMVKVKLEMLTHSKYKIINFIQSVFSFESSSICVGCWLSDWQHGGAKQGNSNYIQLRQQYTQSTSTINKFIFLNIIIIIEISKISTKNVLRISKIKVSWSFVAYEQISVLVLFFSSIRVFELQMSVWWLVCGHFIFL